MCDDIYAKSGKAPPKAINLNMAAAKFGETLEKPQH
jgi:hypothetical protein